MKKILGILLFLAASVLLVSCGTQPSSPQAGKLSVVTTIFPEYDWVRQILGSHEADIQLTMLLDDGVDLHSFQPTADDMLAISNCDFLLYVGGESDRWVADVLKAASNPDMKAISLLELLGDGVKEEELVEGMEHEHEEEANGQAVGDGEAHESEADEHVWLSLKNAKTICTGIAEQLCALDPANAEDYQKNLRGYLKQLDQLDADYQSAVDSAARKTLVFGDRFPFRYLTDDYGLDYYAAFSGCSAESEASFETIAFLANKVDELDLNYVLTIENATHNIAQAVTENTDGNGRQILAMDSMQSVTAQEVRNGATYLSVMEKNLDVLKQALA